MSTDPIDNLLPDDLLPSLPPAAQKALELVGSASVDPREFRVLIERDELMTARILKAVNTGRFDLPEPCTSLEAAMGHLGLNTVRLLVIGFSLVDLTKELGGGLDLSVFWWRCFYAAAAARRIAVLTGSCDPEVAFIAGLMQDIGMLAMLSVFGDQYREILIEADGSHADLPDIEMAAVGFTHADASAHLGSRWGLNAELVAPIRLHHQSVIGLQDCSPAVNTVALASRMSLQEDLDTVVALSKKLFDLTPEQTRDLMQQTANDTKCLSGLLDMTDTPDRPGDLRQRFEHALVRRFEQAAGRDGCLGLIIGETDAMDDLMSRFGADAAGRTTDAMFERVRRRAGVAGEPLQLPDGRFAILVPGASRTDTARLAEGIRNDVGGAAFDVRDDDGRVEPLLMSMSAGAAALEPAVAKRLNRPDDLLRVAENALRAAVRSGRDCVRVFTPRRQAGDGRSHAA